MKFWITKDSLRTGKILCIEAEFMRGGKSWVEDLATGCYYPIGQWSSDPEAAMRSVHRKRSEAMGRLRRELDRLSDLEVKII